MDGTQATLERCLAILDPLSGDERGQVLAELVRTYGLPPGTTVLLGGGARLVIGPPVMREDGSAGWRAASWTDDKDGRRDSSELFAAAARDVERLLRESAYCLINGGVADVAGLIMAQIAHQDRAPWPQVREAIRREGIATQPEGAARPEQVVSDCPDALEALAELEACCLTVTVEINPHRDVYQSLERWLKDNGITPDEYVERRMVETDSLVCVSFCRLTPLVTHLVAHHDLRQALLEAVELARAEGSCHGGCHG